MENIDLNKIKEEHVSGTWEVKECININKKNANPFSSIREIEIENGIYRSNNGVHLSGEIQIVRENDLVYNPQLKFYEKEQEVANAIITRLFTVNEGSVKKWQLTIYFTTGLELVLQKKFNLK